jgi:hypothetical protein
MQSKLDSVVINSLLAVDFSLLDQVERETIEEYEKLNKKCDQVISKIKNRKKNKKR